MEGEKFLLTHKRGRRRSLFSSLWKSDCCPCLPVRYVLAIMSSLGLVNVYALRVNLSVAIVEMNNGTSTIHSPGAAKAFNWTSTEQGWVLAAFFYGYLITQLPGGWLAQRVGGKWVFGVGVLMTSMVTLLTPIAAYTSVWFLVAVRILEGLFEGVTFPAIMAMWGKWAPSPERSKLSTITFAGTTVGTIISFPLSGVLCRYGFDGGWPSIFYIFGTSGILWFIFWILLVSDSPSTHPRISRVERLYIESTLSNEEQLPTPWLAIFTSPAVWAIAVTHFCQNWGFYTLLTTIPTYYRQTLPNVHLGNSNSTSIVLNGVYSAIPFTIQAIMVPISGQIADFMRAHWFSTTIVRKVFTTTASVFAAVFLLLAGYCGTTTATAVTFITLAVGSSGMGVAGVIINPLDIAPKYAGVIMGITNCIGTIPGIVGPQLAKAIAVPPNAPKDSPDYINKFRDEWREVFIIIAEIYIFGVLIYLILGSGRKQPWADGPMGLVKERKKTQVVQEDSSSETELEDSKHDFSTSSSTYGAAHIQVQQ